MKAIRTRRLAAIAVLLGVALGCQGAAGQTLDEQHVEAMQSYELGRFIVASSQLEPLAKQGHMRSMEVLGFMHWFGEPLYGAGPWDKATGRELLQSAATQGSAVAAVTLNQERQPVSAMAHAAVGTASSNGVRP